ncbi:MAG: hypothetical protein V7L20_03610 [Nostoc sp.]|uniref:hypothetical protein n=1 Tax=Nostoc sp. TaxID=1180 RepID=UPI002FFBF5B1
MVKPRLSWGRSLWDFQIKKYPIVLEAGGRGRESPSEVQKLDNLFFGVPLIDINREAT